MPGNVDKFEATRAQSSGGGDTGTESARIETKEAAVMAVSADDLPEGGKWVAPGGGEVAREEATYYYVEGRGYFNLKSPELGWNSEPW